jgi:uncharacterized membrane protein YfcA
MDLGYSLAGALVGFLVGLTGVGGGSLMAPVLILLFHRAPAVAIGTDLWFACLTKMAGGVVHQSLGSPDWRIVGRLAAGSLPAAAVTVWWLATYHEGHLQSEVLLDLLAVLLLLTAGLLLFKDRIVRPLRLARLSVEPAMRKTHAGQVAVTVLGAAAVGALVTLTSLGAGAFVAVMLALVYPLRLNAKKIVGTDIIHAIPLTLMAGLGQAWLGNVDGWLLGSLLLGSIPGVVAGSFLADRIDDRLVRYALAAMLVVSGVKMLT